MDFRDVDLGVCRARWWPRDPARVAVMLPGAHYLPAYPLLWFAREAVQRHRWSVVEVWDEYGGEDPRAWVEERARAALAFAAEPEGTLVVAKSVSTLAAPLARELALPAVWLTPLFEDDVVAALREPTAPALLVGGTADELWSSALVSTLGPVEVLELAGVDHALEVDGDPLASIDALRRVTHAIDGFVARL